VAASAGSAAPFAALDTTGLSSLFNLGGVGGTPFGGFLAEGGSVDPGYICGVNDGQGREYFQPQSAGTVIPGDQMSGGDTHNWHIDARGSVDPALTAASVKRAIVSARNDSVSAAVQASHDRARRNPHTTA
jgi:hypothetical protein